eukprot:9321700-Pyramimonas_sp.AAC.1
MERSHQRRKHPCEKLAAASRTKAGAFSTCQSRLDGVLARFRIAGTQQSFGFAVLKSHQRCFGMAQNCQNATVRV